MGAGAETFRSMRRLILQLAMMGQDLHNARIMHMHSLPPGLKQLPSHKGERQGEGGKLTVKG